MDITVETKDDFIAAASEGLPRVAEAIIAAPTEARVCVIEAVVESYRQTARAFFDEEETTKWLMDVVAHLEAEVCEKEKQQVSEQHIESVPLVPIIEPEHAGFDALAFRF
jgi:hypothetical protein